ncbi:MAG TPA: carotenoid oxygenase family protein [Pseudonocardiaceae bacterium]|jgi:carotenoid cleavage dioxygenase|nr:carotenoid oxygenase family protein [Pseudonocardiaceae bacterium]
MKTYLSGAMAPVPDEIGAADLPVTGALPTELRGRYFRNGPNPLPGTDPGHNFLGQGMLHGVRIEDGRALWYRNRWVRTALFDGAAPERRCLDLAATTANTHVIQHAGRILSLVENGIPHEVTADLETVGPYDFGGRLTTAMTAHPKVDPATGELHFFGYGVRAPYLTYHVLSAAGELTRSTEITVPGPTMMHDFAITENYVLWLDLPVVFDVDLAANPGMPYRWSDAYAPRIGVMRRDGTEVRWIDVTPGYVFHVGNAHEDATGRIVLDAVRYDRAGFASVWRVLGGTPAPAEGLGHGNGGSLYRWVLDPVTARVSEQRLDDQSVEFPTLNDDYTGRDHQYVYAIGTPVLFDDEDGPSIVKYDIAKQTKESRALPTGWVPGECVFVPAEDGTDEDHGWLMSIVTHETKDAAHLLVLDASDVAGEPVATVMLPRRVPAGFHGSWIADQVY